MKEKGKNSIFRKNEEKGNFSFFKFWEILNEKGVFPSS